MRMNPYFKDVADRMRVCLPLLPDPGPEVVGQCLDAIEQLRAERDALREFAQETLRYVYGGNNPPIVRAAERHGLLRWNADIGAYLETPLLTGEDADTGLRIDHARAQEE